MNLTKNQSGVTPFVSIVTVIKQGGEAPIASLTKQQYENPFEIMVVEGGNRSQARNLAVSKATAPLVAFIDADCEAPPDWLKRLVAGLLNDQTIAGLGGVSTSKNSFEKFGRAIDGLFSTYLGSLDSPSLISIPSQRRSLTRAVSCHNSIFRKSSLIEIGGFDDRFEFNEDTDICARLRERGCKLILDRSLFVHHIPRNTIGDFARQFFWYGVGRTRSMLTNSRYVDTRILGLFLAGVFLGILAPIRPFVFLAILSGYSLVILGNAIAGAKRIHSLSLWSIMALLLLVEHLSYFIGLLCGLFLGPWKQRAEAKSMRVLTYHVSSNKILRFSIT